MPNPEKITDVYDKIIAKILNDINSRSGFGEAWRLIGESRKKEIISRWKFLIREEISKQEELNAKQQAGSNDEPKQGGKESKK